MCGDPLASQFQCKIWGEKKSTVLALAMIIGVSSLGLPSGVVLLFLEINSLFLVPTLHSVLSKETLWDTQRGDFGTQRLLHLEDIH